MTYQIKKTTGTYNARGTAIVKEVSEILMSSDDLLATMKFRYDNNLNMHFTGRNTVVKYSTVLEGREIFFDEMFLILEGQAAFDAVMNGTAPDQSEEHYVRAAA
jgi:hypothetical protein